MIPQTLLWVGLIVAWLVVLVPMLAARHPRVNQVSDATLKTRLLHRGGSAGRAVRRRIRPAATVVEEPRGECPADADAGLVDDEIVEDGRIVLGTNSTSATDGHADDDAEAHAYVDSDVDDLHGSSPMDGDTTPIHTVERAVMSERTKVTDLDHLDVDAAGAADEAAEAAEAAEYDDTVDEVPVDEQLTEELAPVARPVAEDDAECEDEHSGADAAQDDAAEPRRRRGGYDPENDARITEARFRFRQRVTLVLGVLAVVTLGAGLMNVPLAWYGLGAVVLALVAYLAYLRRSVRIETEIRRRRTARLERARRERAREAEVRDGVPAHLRRGGCVVMEIDDEDPAFDHLPRYRAEEFDFLDRPADVREPYERKVG